jgi:hypothetical protein
LCAAFIAFADSHYVKRGKPTDEVRCYESLISVWTELFGLTPLQDFGPNQLRAVRDAMIAKGWTRGYINRQINRLRHMVKWAVGRDGFFAALQKPFTLRDLARLVAAAVADRRRQA